MILVPVRLGLAKSNPIYFPHLKSLLSLTYCVGIIGGRPNESLYFMGYQGTLMCGRLDLIHLGDNMVYLDPHYVQETIKPSKHVDGSIFDVCTEVSCLILLDFQMQISELH